MDASFDYLVVLDVKFVADRGTMDNREHEG